MACRDWKWNLASPADIDPRRARAAIIFNPANPDLQLLPKTMQLLADETQNPAIIIPEDKLDSPLIFRRNSSLAALWVSADLKGTATIEFLVDETGRVHLPRIIQTKNPEAAHILMQEVSLRTYDPPLLNGTPVTARARETINFDNPNAALSGN